MGFLGILVFMGLAVAFSRNRKAIDWRLVGSSLAIQLLLAFLLLRTGPGLYFFDRIGVLVHELYERFQREVETIACLGHPNVVMAYDADEANVGHFLVMEFVNGLDLAACVERSGPMSVAKAVDCILQSARGLAYAHSQGIVHRDDKPQSFLLAENGGVKVNNLGLAPINEGA